MNHLPQPLIGLKPLLRGGQPQGLPLQLSAPPGAAGETHLPSLQGRAGERSLPEELAAPGRLLLLAAPHAAAAAMLALCAEMAHRGCRVHVLDGGNRFNAYLVARRLQQLAYDPTPDPYPNHLPKGGEGDLSRVGF